MFMISLLFIFSACGNELKQNNAISATDNPTVKESNNENTVEKKTLVVYFSATGTTKTLSEYAADILNADIYEIVPAIPYTDEDLAYYTDGRADQEQMDNASRPAISEPVKNIEQYETIILGYPIWHGQAPRIISTFLESYDFSNKTILPFCTSQSSGIGSSDANLHSLADNAKWLEGRRFAADTARETIKEWLNIMDIKPDKSTFDLINMLLNLTAAMKCR